MRPSATFSDRRASRRLLVLLAALPLLVTGARTTLAATPPSDHIAAPDTGSVSRQWTGTVPPGSGGIETCIALVNSDVYELTLDPLAPDYYTSHSATLQFTIEWEPASTQQAQDLKLRVEPPTGEALESDGGSSVERVTFTDPPAGLYTVFACSFLTALPQDYDGDALLTAFPRTPPVNPPATPTDLRFGPITTVDPQRPIAEPSIRIDGDGNEYTCGPTGLEEYIQKSEDGGDTFRVLGTQPEGKVAPSGGGDCEISVAPVRNPGGYYTLSYTGLEELLNFSTSRSEDAGRSFTGTPTNEAPPVVDRQWLETVGASTVYLTYNNVELGGVLQRSSDGGLTYGLPVTAIPVLDREGNIIHDNRAGHADGLFITYAFEQGVHLARTSNASAATPTFDQVTVVPPCASPAPPDTSGCATGAVDNLFPSIAQDAAGNLYVAWVEKGGYNVYYSASTDGGTTWSKKVQVNRGDVFSTVLPWIDAGDDGRIAISFYGSVGDGNPELGTFRGPWHVYVNTVTAAHTIPVVPNDKAVSQTKATTHPIHWNSICLSGLGCDLNGGDRTLLDFFQVRHDPQGRIRVVYNESNKHYTDEAGRIAIVTYSKQTEGGDLIGAAESPDPRPVVDFSRADPAGDALFPFSVFPAPTTPPSPPFRTNYPAMDLRSLAARAATASGAPAVKLTMKLADLSPAAIQTAQAGVQAPNLLYVARIFSGYEAHAAIASVDATGAFTFGYDDTETAGVTFTTAQNEIYVPRTPIPGTVDSSTGEITMTVPLSLIDAIVPNADPTLQPTERKAINGDVIHELTGFAFGNPESDPSNQFYLSEVDVTPPFDYELGTNPGGPPPPPIPAISINDSSVIEGDTGTKNVTFTLSLAHAATVPITVHYQTANGTAKAGPDYQAASGDITFPAGKTTSGLNIAVKGDTLDETNEKFYVNLSGAKLADNQGRATITDNDPAPRLSVADIIAHQTSSNSQAVFTVKLNKASGRTVTVHYATRGGEPGEDYVARSGTLTFSPGQTQHGVSITIIGESNAEGDEVFYLDLSGAVNATIADGTAKATITQH